jgi:hypothetical protein
MNHLCREISPYLLQHAGNPVDWYAWGPEGLQQARAEQKPIFLSIGYSACHPFAAPYSGRRGRTVQYSRCIRESCRARTLRIQLCLTLLRC